LHYTGQVPGRGGVTCTADENLSFTISAHDNNTLDLYPHQVGTPNARRYAGAIGKTDPPYFRVNHICPGGAPPVMLPVPVTVWTTGGPGWVDPDGTARGTYNQPHPGGFMNYQWNVAPATP